MVEKLHSISLSERPDSSGLQLSLDSEMNAGASTFKASTSEFWAEAAYCMLFPVGYDVPYSFSVSKGSVARESTRLPFVVTDEVVTFTNSTSGSLSYIPNADGVSWEWDGAVGPNPVFDLSSITLPSSFSGVLKCSYTAYYDSLKVECLEAGDVLLVVSQEGYGDASLSITFEASEGMRTVRITAKNFCTGEVVPSATIELTGPSGFSLIASTGADGVLVAGQLHIGSTYTMKITAAGFTDSDLDSLDNASFTVE